MADTLTTRNDMARKISDIRKALRHVRRVIKGPSDENTKRFLRPIRVHGEFGLVALREEAKNLRNPKRNIASFNAI
ncbi:MAG: hypothetical protein ABR981_01415 [Candidatus Micrarchaeaceae archaeon]|jgi:hypothetical protein